MTDTCTICKQEPCECEISEADYEYGEPDQDDPAGILRRDRDAEIDGRNSR